MSILVSRAVSSFGGVKFPIMSIEESTVSASRERSGVFASIACYVFWGLCPIYWKLLGEVNSFEIVAHRIIWCMVFTVLVCKLAKLDFRSLARQPRALGILSLASVLNAVNWSIYVVAVQTNHIVEASLGYYINPLVSILLGVLIFKERLTRIQVAAVILSCGGVAFFTLSYGQFPWIAISLAVTFGLYGAVKKKGAYPAVPSLAVESMVMTIPALIAVVALGFITGGHGFLGDTSSAHGWFITFMLVGAGLVTAFPLILFAVAANRIPLSVLGFVQFLSPTISLFVGVFLYGEPVTLAHIVCLTCIWIGLAMVMGESLSRSGKSR